jgi:hypothetical protein
MSDPSQSHHDPLSFLQDVNAHHDDSDFFSAASTTVLENSHVHEKSRLPIVASSAIVTGNSMPDPSGLGWPGEIFSQLMLSYSAMQNFA